MRLGVVLGLAIALAVAVVLVVSSAVQPPANEEVSVLRLFISPENGSAVGRWELCGVRIYGRGAFYKAGEVIQTPLKDIPDLPARAREQIKRWEPSEGWEPFGKAEVDTYVYDFYLDIREGPVIQGVEIREMNISYIGSPTEPYPVAAGGRVRWMVDVKAVTSRNATVFFICGSDKEQVAKKAQEIHSLLARK
ncbi:hypothetical protein [Pyrobaculum neutrophilum]|uniref:Uncharacterized protein n=1 Tax=Pyrobaculum neutrophilum (strain DSM 2338 / JCM 9278 / NBRC 100436 / V24Sta) TaxID=444157 RepID=B1YBC4_PYRNV|nr:hypothetical protein [Pyrobaculum neutrophilum]ACB39255.1 conserved hypothetical protein [Pyrobaculum neutrophilum V24Sta]